MNKNILLIDRNRSFYPFFIWFEYTLHIKHISHALRLCSHWIINHLPKWHCVCAQMFKNRSKENGAIDSFTKIDSNWAAKKFYFFHFLTSKVRFVHLAYFLNCSIISTHMRKRFYSNGRKSKYYLFLSSTTCWWFELHIRYLWSLLVPLFRYKKQWTTTIIFIIGVEILHKM